MKSTDEQHAAPAVPTYTTDGEVHAARAMYGASYDRLVATGTIVAPTRAALPDDVLTARLAPIRDAAGTDAPAHRTSKKSASKRRG